MLISAELAPGDWLHARLLTPRADPWLAARLAAATLLLYILVLGTMIFLAARIARPLRDLAAAAEGFGGSGETPFVTPRGPSDLAHAIDAFNAMNRRVAALLAEKDHMLGALSHDLRTPLASLRIRAENIEPEEERLKVVGTIEEMTAMLEDSLLLVRAGRTREKTRPVDVGALADVVVEEFRELGHDVSLTSEGRQIACVSPALLRRAIRNLVDNAVKYGGSAEVSVRLEGAEALIQVADKGPGIPAAELERVQEPFFRLEESRNRATGGTGLGLTIARAIAEGAGGTLRLANLPDGGLCATIAVPRETVATN
jgi:signal transduction histidine kinase